MKKYEDLLENSLGAFKRFEALILSYNEKVNLTSIVSPRDVEIKHFLDSIAGEFLFPEGADVAEVGSGGGFPSIPLMIVRSDLKFTLIESTGKKCEFLETVLRELGLKNGRVVWMRAEDAGKNPAFREKFDVCCARGVARLNTLAEYCLPLVRRGGTFIAYKGERDETEEGRTAISLLGGKLSEIFTYELPENAGKRSLVVVKKERKTPDKYPRGNGKERSKPLL